MNDYDMSIHTNPDAQAWAKLFIEKTNDMDRDAWYQITEQFPSLKDALDLGIVTGKQIGRAHV